MLLDESYSDGYSILGLEPAADHCAVIRVVVVMFVSFHRLYFVSCEVFLALLTLL
jgi:hypothetical protein